MKITDYKRVETLRDDDVFLLDGLNGTKTIKASDLSKEVRKRGNIYDEMDSYIPVELRRNIFRGNNLGSVVTNEQYEQIAAGTFRGMYLGDYWVIGNRIWRIVDFDYWYNTGDTICTIHHLVIMPDHVLYNVGMNDTAATTGAYVGSKMYTSNLTDAKTIVNSAFTAAHVLNHREYLQNAVTSGHASAGAWFDSTVELPNEIMMYGSYIFTPAGNGTVVVNRYTLNKSQLAGMKVSPYLINPHRENQWLRDVVSNTYFATVTAVGIADANSASHPYGVRVVFGLKK